MTFDAGAIEATLELKRDPFQRGLDQARLEGENFARDTFSAKLDADTSEATAKAAETGSIYDVLRENIQRSMKLDVNADEPDRKAVETAAIYDVLRHNLQQTIHIKTETDRSPLDRLKSVWDSVKRDILGSGGGGGGGGIFKNLISGAGDFGSSLGDAGFKGGALVNTLLLGFPLVVAAVIPLVGLVGALGAGFVGAGLAAGGFGALAIPLLTKMIKDHQALAKAQQAYTAATTSAQRKAALQQEAKATDNLTGSERGLFGMLQRIVKLYDQLQKEFARPIASALQPWFKTASDLLKLLPDLVRPVIEPIKLLGNLMDALVRSPGFQQFFKQLGRFGANALYIFGLSLINLATGFLGLVKAFEPLARVLLPGLVKLTNQFAEWGLNVGKTKGFHQFVQYTIQNLPQLGKLLSQLFILGFKLIVAFAPLGAILLRVAAGLLQLLNSMPSNKLLTLILGIGLLIGGITGIGIAVLAAVALVVNNWPRIVKTFDSVRHETSHIFDLMRHEVAHLWDELWSNTIGRMQRGQQDTFRLGDEWRHHVANTWDGLRHDVANIWDIVWNNTVGRLQRGIHDVENLFDGWRHHTANWFDGFRHDIASAWDTIWNNTVGRVERGVRDVGTAVNKIKGVFETPINWVIKNVLNRLIGGFDWITSHIGLRKPIPTIKLAAGGRIPGFGGGDTVPALLERGETVVDKNRSNELAPIFRAAGVRGYATGGRVGNPPPGRFPGLDQPKPGSAPGIFGGIENFFKGIYDVGRITTAAITGNKKALTNALSALIGHGVGGARGDLAKLLIGLPETLLADVVKWIIGHAGFASGNAIVKYAASWLGKVPYVWGGTALPGGADCSGFVQTIYKRFGYEPPRTSEEQGAWVRRSAPTPGGLAFFNSPAGGPPPGHVGIVMDRGRMISQAGPQGVLGPTVSSIAGRMFAGIPPGGFRGGKFGGPGSGVWHLASLERLWDSVGGPPGLAHIMGAIAEAESGGDPGVRNPSGASGLWQILGLPFPGNPFNPTTNARMALAKYRSQGLGAWATYTSGAYRQFMDRGGPVPPGTRMITNATGRNEEVLTPQERAAFVELAKLASSGAGFGSLIGTYNQVYPDVGQTAHAMNDLLLLLRHASLQPGFRG